MFNLFSENPASLRPVKNQVDEAAMLNNMTYADYYHRLRLLALAVYKWEGLPESMNERFLEQTLYNYGRAVFVDDPELGFINLKCTPANTLNIYELPTKYECYSLNYNKMFPADQVVLVRNNYDMRATALTIQLFARRLYNVERAMEVNVNAQKTPVLILCDEQQRLTMKNVYMQWDGNCPVIYGNKNFNVNDVKSITTAAPYVTDKLSAYKRNVWGEALSFLGINNVETEKAERLTKDEVNANNQLIETAAQVGLLAREQAAEEANRRLWPGKYHVTVKMRTFSEIREELLKGGADNAKTNTNDGDNTGGADQ